jgi:Mrp family chromosome partitioning ATPase/capsular polysaccharide biosynthesis protein
MDAPTQSAGARRPGGGREHFLFVLWRRKGILILTFVLITASTAIVSKNLPRVYEATSTLWVSEEREAAAFDAVQAGEVLARTYARIADSRAIAERVADEAPFEITGGVLLRDMAFEPVSETQLLRVTAENRSATRARLLANLYAEELIDYSRTELANASDSRIAVADVATTPTQPARPKPTLYTIVGALLALGVGVGLAFLAELVDRRIRRADELGELLDVPILAEVPIRSSNPAARVAFDETFRLLRTNLQFLGRGDRPIRSLTVVSPSEGDGKSSVALNLAVSFAEAGQDVLLVEGDMRRPGLSRSLRPMRPEGESERVTPEDSLATPVDRVAGGRGGGVHPTVGLSTYLSESIGIRDVIFDTDIPHLRVIPAGLLPPNPSTLLDPQRCRMLLDEAMAQGGMVVIDTPPLSVGAEGSTLAASSDGALMVVDLRVSYRPVIKRAREQLDVLGAHVLGAVVNRVRRSAEVGAYAYTYRYTEGERSGLLRRRRDNGRRAREREGDAPVVR